MKKIEKEAEIRFQVDKWVPPPQIQQMIDEMADNVLEAFREFERDIMCRNNMKGENKNES